jgi:hypothetical protein
MCPLYKVAQKYMQIIPYKITKSSTQQFTLSFLNKIEILARLHFFRQLFCHTNLLSTNLKMHAEK